MTRPTLRLANQRKAAIPYSMLRKAVRMFRGSYLPRTKRHALIRRWLQAVDRLGDKSVYKGGKDVRWSHPQVLTKGRG